MRRTSFLAVATAFLLVILLGAEPAFAQRGRGGGGAPAGIDQETLMEDFDSIVDLIWTDDEEDAWKDLDNDDMEGKQAFITSFWEVRDPTPSSADNEFRDVWMQRVAYAARAFGNEGRNGWETDRGKFYMIYGPEVVTAQENKQVSGSKGAGETSAGTRLNIIWTVDPTQNSFLDDKDEVVFSQYQRSFSKLTGGIDYNQDAFLAGAAVKGYFEARRANPAAAGPAAAATAPAAGGGAAPAAAPTADMLAMQELMQTGATRQDLMLTQDMGFIPAAEGNTFSMFNFELGKDGLTMDAGPASLLAFGVLFKKDLAADGGEEYMRDIKAPFSVDPDNGNATETSTHSFGMTLAPGDYRLAWGVMDNASERIVTTNYEFSVPNYAAAELEIPSVIVAAGLEQMTDTIDVNTVYSGTRVGNLELSTDLQNVFGRNDSLLLLYFIKGLAPDAATQQPTFEVDHRLLIAGTEESIARLPTQTLNFGAIQQEIPLAQVQQLEAGGEYEIEIHITDQVNGAEITQRVPFTVRGG